MTLAIDDGPTDVALLDVTIGENLRRTIAAHGDNEALVARHQGIRWTYTEFGERVERLSAGLLGLGIEAGDRVGLWSPNYAEWTLLQYATATVGRSSSTSTRPTGPTSWTYALNQSGVPRALRRAVVQDVRLRRDGRPGRGPGAIALERVVFFWEDEWDEVVAGAGGVDRRASSRPRGVALTPTTRSTSSTRPAPRGSPRRHAHPPQHPQQRLLRRPPAGLHQPPTGCASRCPSTTASAW